MANVKITELTNLTDPSTTDVMPVVDVDADVTKKVSVGEVVGKITGDVEVATDGTATISELPVSKLADGTARQLLQTDAAGTGVEWTSNVDVPGTLDVTGAAAFDSTGRFIGDVTLDSNLIFEGSTADGFETTLTVVDPTADRTITLPDVTGTVITTSDTGTVTSTMILDGTIVNDDVNASAAIAGTKIDPDFGSQTVETTGVINAGSGTEGAPSVSVGTTDNGLYSPGTDQVAISVNGTERVKFGTSEVVFNDGGENYDFRIEGDTEANLFFVDASTDRIGLGTSTPVGKLTLGNSTNNFLLDLDSSASYTELQSYNAPLYLNRQGNNTILNSGGGSVGINTATPGVALHVDGDIRCDGVYGETDTNTSIQFPGSDVITFNKGGSEAARIDSDGTVLIGVATKVIAQTTNPFVFFQAQATTATSGLTIESYGNNTATRYHFGFTNSNGVVGTISTNGSATAYNTSSDYRLKENVVPLTDASDRLNQLQVHRFNFIADPSKTVDGFIAHEAQAVVPECVTGTKDEVDADGNPVYQGIDQSKLVPLLTAALQEALQKIETLEQRLSNAGIA